MTTRDGEAVAVTAATPPPLYSPISSVPPAPRLVLQILCYEYVSRGGLLALRAGNGIGQFQETCVNALSGRFRTFCSLFS